MPADWSPAGSSNELERLRMENETLSAVVGVVASGPDLGHILDRVVDLLTRATDCHACFVYLRRGERLQLRAASPVFAHLVGKVGFGVDEGLAGWVARRGEAAFIREGAIEDPRTHYVPELEEERFQSMVAVPIPTRAGESLGAIVLHTAAPREFDERVINVLSRAASLVAGAIENARLYEEAQERVEALTELSALGRDIAAVDDRHSLFALASDRIREIVGADVCRIYAADLPGGALDLVAAAPAAEAAGEDGAELTVRLLEETDVATDAPSIREQIAATLDLAEVPAAADVVGLAAGGRRIGAMLVVAARPWAETTPSLLRTIAQQLALATQKIELIERLTEENLARDLFDALVDGDLPAATAKARAARIDLDRKQVVLESRARDPADAGSWAERAERIERTLKAALPQALCDITAASMRAVIPLSAGGTAATLAAIAGLADRVAENDAVCGVSEPQPGAAGAQRAIQEAADAARIAQLLDPEGGILHYRETGAYRYLIDLLESGGPRDHLHGAVETLIEYDRSRRTQLLPTLDEYLSQGRSVAVTARVLFIHVNTLRQRLERIEQLTGLDTTEEDLLALQLAVKLGRIRAAGGQG
jgi:GAF domain-containing protein